MGILVGTSTGKALKVVDAMPLFHTHALAPMLKIACMLIEEHCREVGDLEIVGLYHAAASGVPDMSRVKPIADKIAANFPAACVWAVDAAKLGERQFALRGMCHSKEEWKPISADAVSLGDEALQHTSRAISELKHLEIVDFDDHLGDASLSWLNASLFKGDALAELGPADLPQTGAD
uniref:MPN domain-containing protein n=1 Tax=Zooxanthella nutricula TaxID=1333877 RepID=A0A7S2QED8_9DINO